MIKDILEKHKVYSVDLELDLLRHFEKLRNEILKEMKECGAILVDGGEEMENE